MKSFLSQRAACHATLERICSARLSDRLRTHWHHAYGMLAVRTANQVCTNSIYVYFSWVFFFLHGLWDWKLAFLLDCDVRKQANQSLDVKTSCQSMFASSGAGAPGASQNFWGACVCEKRRPVGHPRVEQWCHPAWRLLLIAGNRQALSWALKEQAPCF